MSTSRERASSTEKRSNKEPNRGACGKHPEDGFGGRGFAWKRVRPIREKKEGDLHPFAIRPGIDTGSVIERYALRGAVGGDVCPVARQALAGTWI
jgi:hypothetical protein